MLISLIQKKENLRFLRSSASKINFSTYYR
ncbi:MAG: hypothetical protein CNIPEHKO_02785 [Anaerolineales bacterium]|nr:hypothetical protein [Anaerolineales bacterium]